MVWYCDAIVVGFGWLEWNQLIVRPTEQRMLHTVAGWLGMNGSENAHHVEGWFIIYIMFWLCYMAIETKLF